MLYEIKFNLSIAISLLVTGVLILILTIFEFITYTKCNKFLIFKKQKITNFGWTINLIVLLIAISITALLFILNISQTKYLPYAIVWVIVACLSLFFLITRSILTTKSKKSKYEIKNILSLQIEELANKFKIKILKNPTYNVKHLEKDAWYKNIKENFNSLANKIANLNKDNLVHIVSEIITFEEMFCSTVFNKRNKYAFCLFLILLSNLQKKFKA